MTSDVSHPAIAAPGVGFARGLRRYGDRLAVVAPDGARLTYADLADRVDDVRDRLGPGQRLVQIAASNDVQPLVTYLAALAGGHPVLLTAADDRRIDAMAQAYDPDVLLRPADGSWTLRERRSGSAHTLHPDLALLLSTSGSTGSPKLVRLSRRNVQANAESIAEYLGIRDRDRAVTSLPMQYCYGLSVINSNLARGAGLLLTNDSVGDESFWRIVREHRATSIHGVPYTFDLLETSGFADREIPSLRYLTQAGGRLDPRRVRRFAALSERRGWRLFVMYGQTEATARMAYLPPELAMSRPSAIGVAIPGGEFDLASGDEGELIYRGPNVMLGYATAPADLALGRTVDALATGDIARRTEDGLYEIVGRKGRFVKLYGLRIDLDRIEHTLAQDGLKAACAGTDDVLSIAVVGAGDDLVETVQRIVADRAGLPPGRVRVHPVRDLPRRDTGKVDYAAVRELGSPEPEPATRTGTVREIFAKVLHRVEPADIDDDATFVTLGGDSMSYVQASIALQKALGGLPPNWQNIRVADLEADGRRRRPGLLASVETNIVLRALAIVFIVGSHIGLFRVLGGAHLLLILAGWAFARFVLPAERDGGRSAGILRSAARIAVPSVLWISLRNATAPDIGLANHLLVNNYFRETGAVGYWFVEALVQILVALGVLFAIPAVARFDLRHRFAMPLIMVAVGLAVRVISLYGFGETSWSKGHMVLWFFALGWLAQRAATDREKLTVVAIALLTIPGFFADPVREGVIVGGLLLVLAVPHLRIPRILVRPIGVVASASLYIYLTHYALWPDLTPYVAPLPLTLAAVALGVATWALAEAASRGIARGRTLLSTR